MKAREIMSSDPVCCTPENTIAEAAQLMKENDCGCLPVVEDLESKKLVGTITDRDIACRCVAEGKGTETPVREAMSPDPSCCGPEDDVSDVSRIMQERQVRRVPVIDEQGCCVGMIAQADLANSAKSRTVADVVEKVSTPTSRERSDSEAGRRPDQR